MRKGGKREEGKGKRVGLIAFSLFLLASSLAGCTKKHPKTVDAKKDPPEESPVKSAATGAGDVTVYGDARATAPSFTLRWKEGSVDAASGTVGTGRLVEPAGEIYQGPKPASTYRADTGDAARAARRLNMDGNVVLQTIDKAQTLKAPHGEYRGDLKIVRATGGVTAHGTFGTLTGVPELWATPDLKLIGTPDMVAKTLKLPALAALAATAATGAAKLQNGPDTLTNYGPFKYDRKLSRVTASPLPGRGPILLRMPERGLVFRLSGTVVVDLDAKGTQVLHMTTRAPVNVVQTTPTGTNTIDGTSAQYDAKPNATTADLQLGGRVTLVSEEKGAKGGTTTTSKGDRGSAVLRAKPTGDRGGLQSATLTGDVTIDSKGEDAGAFRGTGDRMVYTPGTPSSAVDLTGHVVLTRTSKGADGTANTVVSRGERAHAVLDATPSGGSSPMRNALLDGGVAIDVSGSNGQTFKGTGDRVVYTGTGPGGTAVMTGALRFTGDTPAFLGDMTDVDTATVTIGKDGWETVETGNSKGTPTTTTINPKADPNAPKKTPPAKGGKRPPVKKGRKGP